MRSRFRSTLRAFGVALGVVLFAHASLAQTEGAAPADGSSIYAGMVLVPAGEFLMGSPASDASAATDEQPQRVVNLPAFYIDALEVTNIEYKRFVDATNWPVPSGWVERSYPEGFEFLPVTGVSWWDATAYARWRGKRLPTEAEWEKAARGTKGARFPWGDEFSPDRANNDMGLLPAGSLPQGASPYGVMDMAGNAAEWTASIYGPYPKQQAQVPGELGGAPSAPKPSPDLSMLPAAAVPDPKAGSAQPAIAPDDPRLAFLAAAELKDHRHRVYRGGSFNNYSGFLRCASRRKAAPGDRWDNLGFRCAADPGSNQAPQGRAP